MPDGCERGEFLNRAAPAALLAFLAALGCMALQANGIAAVIALCLAPMLVFAVWKQQDVMIPAAFTALALLPFFLGVSRTPRIFFDEVLLLMLLAVVALQTFFGKIPLRLRGADVALALLCLALMALTMFYNKPSNMQLRSFIETFGLGTLLCLTMAQASTEKRMLRVAVCLAIAVSLISFAGIVESAARSNPLMEYVEKVAAVEFDFDFLYFSQEIMDLNNAIYRPYVIFFHPSEGGTFVGMCLPLIAVLLATGKYRKLACVSLFLGAVFLLLNMTRGVWAACAITAFLFFPKVRRFSMFLIPVLLGALLLLLVFYADSPFVERLLNPKNLLIRFLFWETSWEYFLDHWLVGVGFYNFSEVYSASMAQAPAEAFSDAAGIATVDNIFFMVLVEQGLLGLIGFVILLLLLLRRMLQSRKALDDSGKHLPAHMVTAGLAGFSIFLFCGMMADVHLFSKVTKLMFMSAGMAWGLGASQERQNVPGIYAVESGGKG